MWKICQCQLRVFTVLYVIARLFVTSLRDTSEDNMRALWGPKKTNFKFFEIFILSELVCTYDKIRKTTFFKTNHLESYPGSVFNSNLLIRSWPTTILDDEVMNYVS